MFLLHSMTVEGEAHTGFNSGEGRGGESAFLIFFPMSTTELGAYRYHPRIDRVVADPDPELWTSKWLWSFDYAAISLIGGEKMTSEAGGKLAVA
eukprot:NODE_2870_length_1024_cov_5.246154_g2405_i0.p1 GENE.NODE_2870_length_1024_cov_5.246154_g2405_i0~~NODE_2870_length_1024_cov_5.246154_g2405_i0.p1  ORF type:complete len:94 (-),score=3.46 NODE_2870_length_1024_cov_5.246154_g2405_i0:334-615(-)